MRPDLRLIRLVPALRVHAAVCAAAGLSTAVAVLVQAEVVARGLVDMVDGASSGATTIAVGLGISGAVRAGARWATDRSAVWALGRTRDAFAAEVTDRLDRLDGSVRPAVDPAEAAGLVTSAVDATDPWVKGYLPALGVAAFVPLAAGLRILVADVTSAAILAVAIPLIPVFMVLIGRLTQERADRDWATLTRLTSHFRDVLTGIDTLRLFGRAGVQVDRVRAVTCAYRDAVMRTLRVAFLSAFVLELLATLSVALVAVTAGVRLADGSMTLRTGLVVLLLAPECSLPLRRVAAAFHAATAGSDAVTALERFRELPTVRSGSYRPDAPVDSVAAHGVTVSHPGRATPVGPVDLHAGAGELVALTGASGSGKSTVLAVLAGEVTPATGLAVLGSEPVERWDLGARRRSVVWIAQAPRPLGRTVAESVRLGCAHASRCDAAQAQDDVGLAALADRSPSEISGGERQRVAVARALVRVRAGGARVVLADEPTAHLDPDATALVVGALRSAAASGAAVVVATHDPAVMAASDRQVHIDPPPPVPSPAAAGVDGHAGATVDATGSTPPGDPSPTVVPPPGPATARTGDLRWLRRRAPVARSLVVRARALGLAAEACTVGLAASAAWLIVRAAERPSFTDLALVAVAVRAFGIGKGVFRYAERLASHDLVLGQLTELRGELIGHLGRIAPAGVPEPRGELIATVVHDIDRVGDAELRVVGPAVTAVAVSALAVVGVAAIDLGAAGALAAAVVLGTALLPGAVDRRIRSNATELLAARAAVGAHVLDLAEHADELAPLAAIGPEVAEVRGAIERVDAVERSRGRLTSVASGMLAGAGPWTAGVVALILGSASGGLSGPWVAVAVLLPLTVVELLSPSVAGAEMASTTTAAAARLRHLLERPDPTPDPADAVAIPAGGRLDLAAVSFRWPTADAASPPVSARLADHGRLVIHGPSGSGKSTIAAGLVAFLRPHGGAYRLDDVPTTRVRGDDLRRRVTWCPQDPWIADTTVRENLLLARPGSTDDDLLGVLRRVHLDAWVATLPRGLDTPVGRSGRSLSGGERQRLALARVLLADHRVVVLDEPTAQLDGPTADLVRRDLLDGLGERTVVELAHEPPRDGTPAIALQ